MNYFSIVLEQIEIFVVYILIGIFVTLCILCALPTMSSVVMVAENQKSDGDYAAGIIFVTTLISVVTLPVVCLGL